VLLGWVLVFFWRRKGFRGQVERVWDNLGDCAELPLSADMETESPWSNKFGRRPWAADRSAGSVLNGAVRPSVLSQDEDGRQFVVPSGHFLKLPDK